jgi:5-methyltetrahydrofolate--homocysteine methyltransferase
MNFKNFLENNIVYLDGGMGTLLQDKGLPAGELPERWNLTHPSVISEIHKSYYDAGSNVVLSNTFGANILKFSEYELEEIIKSAMENARAARESSELKGEKFIALDIGPTGKLLKPYGDLDFENAVEIFARTVRLGAKYGADLVYIETMSDSYETKAALLAAKENSHLPVIVTNVYEKDGKLMTGADAVAMAVMLEGMGADAIGANCSLGPRQLAPVIRRLLEVCSVPVVLKANAGLPEVKDGITEYSVGKEEFSAEILPLIKEGLRVVGGCCGTTPEYIEELTRAASGITPRPIEKKDITAVSSYTHAVIFDKTPILIGERINPTGKKRLKEALTSGDVDYILGEATRQEEAGADVLDVNVGLPSIDEPELLKSVVREIQAVTDLPLQIDTADALAMEKALRIYNGKPLINSVSGKEESMRKIFPLAKKYGGVVIALTLDENGIPETSEGRVKIAKKILEVAKEYGIDKKDIIFDTLAMAVSADTSSARTTLTALKEIREGLGCHTSLGVSNVSYGLPNRDAVNSTFFTMALTSGLSAAIINPHSADMMRAYYSYKALSGLDEGFSDYIANAESFLSVKTENSIQKGALTEEEYRSELTEAIVKGMRDRANELTAGLLESEKPLDIISSYIIPALDKVGIGYEKGQVYLPQLLMSAESAKAAFNAIKSYMSGKERSDSRATVVIATVEGDIHDIGKNIVKLLLENYGYEVIDLGKNVSPDTIVEQTLKRETKIVFLSALMTTTLPAMERTVKMLKACAPTVKTVVGGAVLTEEYAKRIGADKYARDAMEAVRYAESETK